MSKKVITSIDSLIPLIQESFSKSQDISFTIKGTSMLPFYRNNETKVTISPLTGSLKKYYVYLYKLNDTYLLHRFIKTKNNRYIFRGDALYQYEVVAKENVIGVVTRSNTNGKVTESSNWMYLLRVRMYLFKKSIKLFIRRLIKG